MSETVTLYDFLRRESERIKRETGKESEAWAAAKAHNRTVIHCPDAAIKTGWEKLKNAPVG